MKISLQSLLTLAIIIALGVFSYSSLGFVSNYSKSIEPASFRSFWASGDGRSVAVPDIAQFTYSVITEGKTDVGKLQTDNTAKMNKAIDFVKSKGVDSKDISTQNYSIDPRYQTTVCTYQAGEVCPPAEIVGYTVRQDVSVKVRKFENISGLLTGIVDAGANSVSQLNFTFDDPTAVQDEARKQAIEKAKARAQKIADDTGFTLGRLLEIDDGGVTTPYPRPMMAYDKSSMAGAEMAPTVEPGSQETNVTVRLKYEIE